MDADEIMKMYRKHKFVKIAFDTAALFRSKDALYKEDTDILYLDKVRHICTSLKEISAESDIDQELDKCRSYIEERIENFTKDQSGFILLDITRIVLKMFEANSLDLACYFEISEKLKKR